MRPAAAARRSARRFYAGVHWLRRYLQIDPMAEHSANEEELLLDD